MSFWVVLGGGGVLVVGRGGGVFIGVNGLPGLNVGGNVVYVAFLPERLRSLGENAGKMEIVDANERIYRELKKAANGEKA